MNFLKEIIQDYRKDQKEYETVHSIVMNALHDQNDLNHQQKEQISSKVKTIQDDFIKLLSYSDFLIEVIKTTTMNLKNENQQKIKAVDKNAQLQEQHDAIERELLLAQGREKVLGNELKQKEVQELVLMKKMKGMKKIINC